MNIEILKQLREERPTYRDMIKFCCDDMILNNYLIEELAKNEIFFDFYCGTDYDEYSEQYVDIYQYYIIDSNSADRLSEFTNEIVMYNDNLDLYFLCVTHWGTSWDYVPANWKELDEVAEDD